MRISLALVVAAFLVSGCKLPLISDVSDDSTASAFSAAPATDPGCPAANANPISIQSVSGTDDRVDYPIAHIVDGDVGSFMTTNTLTLGDTRTIWIRLATPTNLREIEVVDNYTNDYNMGDLQISASSDSTNGTDGAWTDIATLTAATSRLNSGDGSISVSADCVAWVRLTMTYNGTGAAGGTPAFYLSEIRLFGI